jgi:uncharacterized phiE125 gp8 family phage protein
VDAQWALVTGPAEEPVSLTDAKLQLRVTQPNQDRLIVSYIQAAREAAEAFLHRGLFTQTWQLTLDGFADCVWLPMAAPLQSVTSVRYYDADGTLQTLASTFYTADLVSRPGRLTRAANQLWPSVQPDRLTGRIVITYVVGWATVEAIPERIKQGIRLYLGYLDADRDGLEPNAAQALRMAEACWDDRVTWIEPQAIARVGW